ncbi:uncharacterized protein LOC115209160 [Octopus sinensis]|uniref:Uncharacterized protein LOC115209160 n=1 Tax=Octopus sinensis TaxID=2607531 RepID=A0A6P7S513_9MOLL|nr:uncharacterized protein LOC115209160 [Octopus sinensis]
MTSPGRPNRKGKKKKSQDDTFQYSDMCLFCETTDDNEEIFGRKVQKCRMTVHYFCMLFSSGLSQKGKTEEDGIFGFLPGDIWKEKSRGSRLKCTFCRRNGATIGCVVKNCRKVFHFGCGQKAGALNQYFDSYSSFCPSHRPRQACQVSDRLSFFGTANSMCVICMNAVEARASNDTLRAPCCKNTWFHRTCIQRQALAAGLHFFKCPLCCNKELFQAEMLQIGIYIPEQDAAWEMEPHAYQELLEPYTHCDLDVCLCPRGRKYNKDDSKWEIIVCHWCGSQGCHVGCISNKSLSRPTRWSCPPCEAIDCELRKERKKKKCSPKQADYSVDMPGSKSNQKLCPSECVSRKLPVKRSTTLNSNTDVRDDNSDSQTANNNNNNNNNAISPVTYRKPGVRISRRNFWKRGMFKRNKKKKPATLTLAEALQSGTVSNCNNPQISTPGSPVATCSGVINKECEGGSSLQHSNSSLDLTPKFKKAFQKHRKQKNSEADVLVDIKNQTKLCVNNSKCAKSGLEKNSKSQINVPYVLRRRGKAVASSASPSKHQNRRRLRSDMKSDLAGPWTVPRKTCENVPHKRTKLVDLTMNSGNMVEIDLTTSPSSSYLDISRETGQISDISEEMVGNSAMSLISKAKQSRNYFNKENSNVDPLVSCDCNDCSCFVLISDDDDDDFIQIPVVLSDSEEGTVFDNLQDEKCDVASCDCKSVNWEYNKLKLSIEKESFSGNSDSQNLISSCYQKQLVQEASCSSSSSLSSSFSSIITLSTSETELGKGCGELDSNSCAFESNTVF